MGAAFRVLVALLILAVIVRFVLTSMRGYVQGARDQAEERAVGPSTSDIEDEDIRYRCVTCGLEVRLTKVPVLDEGEELRLFRHCREEMAPVEELST